MFWQLNISCFLNLLDHSIRICLSITFPKYHFRIFWQNHLKLFSEIDDTNRNRGFLYLWTNVLFFAECVPPCSSGQSAVLRRRHLDPIWPMHLNSHEESFTRAHSLPPWLALMIIMRRKYYDYSILPFLPACLDKFNHCRVAPSL